MTAVKMDYSSKEAKKVLKDYYYWRVLYRDSKAREQLKRYFGYDDPTPCHDNLDHTLDIKRGIDKGILIAAVDRNHDDVISELMSIWKDIDLNDLVNGFLYSLSTGANQYRTALASYFFARSMISHKADHTRLPYGRKCCSVCGLDIDDKGVSHIEDSFSRYTLYYPQDSTIERVQRPDYALFDLKQFKELPKVNYKKEDIDILIKILELAKEMGDSNKYTALRKLITKAKFINASGNEINVILGVLSVCGVLQTPDHRGFADSFSKRSEWGFEGYETELFYPLFFWKGRDGIDCKALEKVFPSSVVEALKSEKNDSLIDEVYSKDKESKPNSSRAQDVFADGKHIVELDDRKRYYYGLLPIDPAWHKEVRYSVTHKSYKRSEIYFEGNSIKKCIFESRMLQKDGTFTYGEYIERDMVAETEERYFLLPKTSKGKKKPWTPSLLESPTYMAATLIVNLDSGLLYTYNWKNHKKLPLPDFGAINMNHIKTPIEFYTYTEELIKNAPDDYEAVRKEYLGT